MDPTISVNDLLFIKGYDSYQIGDIITFVTPSSSLITHRVIEVFPEGYITQGDANNITDEEITSQMVLGKTMCVIPGVGRVIEAILSPAGIVLLVCFFVLIWLIHRISRSKDEKGQINTKQAIEDS